MQILCTSQISEIQLIDKRLDSLWTRVSREHKLPVQPTKPASCRIQCDQSALVTAEEAPPCWEEGSWVLLMLFRLPTTDNNINISLYDKVIRPRFNWVS